MRADEIRLEELVSFSAGLVSLHGRRLVLHDIHAMAQLRNDLVRSMGIHQAQIIFSRFGYFWGEADAAAMKRIFEWDDVSELLKAGPQLHKLQGVTQVRIKKFELRPEGSLHMEVVWDDSVEVAEHLLELDTSPDAGCWTLQGYASGYATYCLGRPVYFVETSCRARGDDVCEAVGRDYESWGDKADALAERFQADDIQGKIEELTTALRKKTLELARERKKLQRVGASDISGYATTRSKSFQNVLDVAGRVARFDSSVLITGESGVGKEVVARFIHDNSARKRGPFLALNCGALPETLLESELFGHRAGSFTGANRDRIGLLEQAQGGTILLDEIGDVPPSLQVSLLRVLQERKIRRVGENQARDIDVRIIAATNKQITREVEQGRFREDLFYRLRVIEIYIPPLRERREDIVTLARFFTDRLARRLKLRRLVLHPSSIRDIERYRWPGNVRELENALERAAVMSEDGWIRPEHLPPELHQAERRGIVIDAAAEQTLAELERTYILNMLESNNGSRTRTAETLGISTTTLWRKLKEYDALDR